jgi:hypothetical protein
MVYVAYLPQNIFSLLTAHIYHKFQKNVANGSITLHRPRWDFMVEDSLTTTIDPSTTIFGHSIWVHFSSDCSNTETLIRTPVRWWIRHYYRDCDPSRSYLMNSYLPLPSVPTNNKLFDGPTEPPDQSLRTTILPSLGSDEPWGPSPSMCPYNVIWS